MNRYFLSLVIVTAPLTLFASLVVRTLESNAPQRIYVEKESRIPNNVEGYVKANDGNQIQPYILQSKERWQGIR